MRATSETLGRLAGLVPAAVQLLAAASILSKNVLADQLGLAREGAAQTRATPALVLVVAGAAFVFWLFAKTTLVGLLLIAYNGITQLFPGVALSFGSRRLSASSVGADIGAGILVLAWAAVSATTTVGGVNVGLAVLTVNVATVGIGEAGRRLLGSGDGDQRRQRKDNFPDNKPRVYRTDPLAQPSSQQSIQAGIEARLFVRAVLRGDADVGMAQRTRSCKDNPSCWR